MRPFIEKCWRIQGTIYYTVDGRRLISGLGVFLPVFWNPVSMISVRFSSIPYGVESDETQEHYFVDVTVPGLR